MQHTSPRPRAGIAWRPVLVLVGACLLAGCGISGSGGDFGEVRSSLVRDDIHDWVGPVAAAERRTEPSDFQLTDDERQLRDLAYPLIEPPYRRKKLDSVFGEYGAHKSFREAAADRAAYFNVLMAADDRSSSTRYVKLIEDIQNDEARLPAFFETATRVVDMDAKRRESLRYITDLPQSERDNALHRIRENAAIISLVSTRLRQRAASYRYALEQLVVRTPSPEAATAERALNRLKSDIVRYDRAPAPTWVRQNSLAANN